jgi:hypothetical protein
VAEQWYRVREPAVVHETVDGEVLVVQLATGAYYSGSGATEVLWNALARGEPTGAIATALAAAWQLPDEEAAEVVDTFAGELVGQGLVEPGSGDPPTGTSALDPGVLGAHAGTTPALVRFDDLADLIQLDPVHDVTDQGWPHVPGDGATAAR